MTHPYDADRKRRSAYVNEVIGDNIRKFRLEQGLTQKELGNLLVGGPAHESYMRSIEKGHKQMSLVRVVEIADTLGVSMTQLVEGL